MTDPKVVLRSLLVAEWGLLYTPVFNADWYDERLAAQQISIGLVETNQNYLGLSNNLPAEDRLDTGMYEVNVWSREDKARRWEMEEEVTRIIRENRLSTELDQIDITSWKALDEVRTSPKIYRSRAYLSLLNIV